MKKALLSEYLILVMAGMKTLDSQKHKGIRWQVILLLFSWLCHSVSGQLRYSIPEEMRKDSLIANIAKDLELDINRLSLRRFRLVSRVSEYFSINLKNGNLYVKDRIDRETLCGVASTCFLTFDAMVENPLNIFTVDIEIQDINDNPPIFFHDIIKLEMIELSPPGTRFALENAEDSDIGNNTVQTYKLSDNQHFTLSEKTRSDGSKYPELVLEKPLDRETQKNIELILTALDGGNPIKSGTVLIRIIVIDVNDNFPIFTQEIYKVSVSENIPINSTVLHVTATDQDEGTNAHITYSFTKTSGDVLYNDMFRINATNGIIKTTKMFDFENIQNYEISIQAKDSGGLVAQSKVLVEITDENDNAPEISVASLLTPVSEDSPPGTLVALIEILDQDSGDNGKVDCQIIDKAPFQLISSSSNRYYRIVTTSALDREKVLSYNITLIATDRGSPPLSSSKIITLDILDVNDNPPVFTKSTYLAYVPENNLPGASIYKIHATDIDSGHNAKVMYSISSSNSDNFPVSAYFSINTETGVIYAQQSFDYEQHKQFMINITAKDKGTPSLSNNTTLILHIVDQNDNAPKILYPSSDNGGSALFEMVLFASEQDSLITKVVAVDDDSGHNAWLSYHFIHAAEPFPFSISQNTGEIRTSRLFQEKDLLKHKAVVMVKDNGDPPLSATVTISFIVAANFQQIAPKISNLTDEDSPSTLQMYLVIAVALISFLFVLSVMLIIISKCKESKSAPTFGSLNLYSSVDPRMISQYSNGTLPLPYNVCVALDSSENDFTFLKPNLNVPVDNLIDTEDSAFGNESLKNNLATDHQVRESCC